MFITGVGTAAPGQRYTQTECWQVAQTAEQMRRLNPRSQILIRKVLLGDNGVEARHLAVDSLQDMLSIDPDTLHARFKEHAPRLGSTAAERALLKSGSNPEAIDALLISTCTGYLCP